MAITAGYFGSDFNFKQRFFQDPEEILIEVQRLKDTGLKVVLTTGSFDIIHIGHCRYLREAKSLGDVLVVGVESDEKVRSRKGPTRPVVPGEERYEMLAHTRYVDLITVKEVDKPKWHLIKLLRPSVLQAVEGTYTSKELEELKEFCGEIVVQPRQAETSTSAKIRFLVMGSMESLADHLAELLPNVVMNLLTKQIATMSEDLQKILQQALKDAVHKRKEEL